MDSAPLTPPVQKPTMIQRIIKQKTLITKIWRMGWILGIAAVFALGFLPQTRDLWRPIGGKLGTLSIFLLGATLLPGMIRRADLRGIFSQVQLPLMVFRRYLGISMFLSGLSHVLLVKAFPSLVYALPLFPLETFEIGGAMALGLAFPLFLTSNDAAVKLFGPWWKRLHTLVYLIAIATALHISLLAGIEGSGLIAWGIVILEALSWITLWSRQQKILPAVLLAGLLFSGGSAFATYTVLHANNSEPDSPKEQLMQSLGEQKEGSVGVFTASVVSLHKTPEDCWTIIDGAIYNLSSYVGIHPGGKETIIAACGADGSKLFATKGTEGRPHSARAKELLAGLKIAKLGDPLPAGETSTPGASPTPVASAAPSLAPTQKPKAASTTLTAEIVATHKSASNCWIIIKGNVYDVTQYIPLHPGGSVRITGVCGADATTAFETKGGGGSHSQYAWGLLTNYKVGVIGQAAVPTALPVSSTTPTAAATTTPVQTSNVTLDNAMIATHNSSSSCWLIINRNVYDVTQYIPMHPGGSARITGLCGQEASAAFNSRGGTGSHSAGAVAQLAGYKIGSLGGAASVNTSTPPTPPITTGGRGEDDDD